MKKFVHTVVVGVTALMLAGVAFAQVAAAPPCKLADGPVYLDGPDNNKTSVVIFVHGVLSSAVDAWSYDSSTSWPCLMRRDAVFNPTSNIYLYAYRTQMLGSSPSIEKVADRLLKDLVFGEVMKQHAHITIVAHSMGGLVVARMLLQMHGNPAYKNDLSRIKLVQFYGTPATGAEIANLASVFSGNPQFEEMRTQKEPKALIDKWKAVNWQFPLRCLAEGAKTSPSLLDYFPPLKYVFSTQVVSVESAAAFCNRHADVLEGFNHISMVKPGSLQSEPHLYLFRNFKSCVARNFEPPTPSEASTPEGELLLSMLSNLRARLSDDSVAGQVGSQQAVQDALYQATGWPDYFKPISLGNPTLTNANYERLPDRTFANEFVGFFRPRATQLMPLWVGRISALVSRVPDGQLFELLRQWKTGGLLQDNDYAVELQMRDGDGHVLVVGAIQKDIATGASQARIRGILLMPPKPPCD